MLQRGPKKMVENKQKHAFVSRFLPIGDENGNEEVNETGNEVETKLVLLCKTGNERFSRVGENMETKAPFFGPLVSIDPKKSIPCDER
jgi:hypothetical protein